MPCNSDHMEPTVLETYTKDTAGLIRYVSGKIDYKVPMWITRAANDIYGARDRADALTAILCGLCRIVEAGGEAKLNDIIYNARTKEGRALAAWWDEHKKADAARGGFDEQDEVVLKAIIMSQGMDTKQLAAIKFAVENDLI